MIRTIIVLSMLFSFGCGDLIDQPVRTTTGSSTADNCELVAEDYHLPDYVDCQYRCENVNIEHVGLFADSWCSYTCPDTVCVAHDPATGGFGWCSLSWYPCGGPSVWLREGI